MAGIPHTTSLLSPPHAALSRKENGMEPKFLSMVFALCLLLTACLATADQVFKSTMPDGSILYGNEPVKGAKKVEKMTPNTQDSGVRITTPHQKQDLDQRQSVRQEESN